MSEKRELSYQMFNLENNMTLMVEANELPRLGDTIRLPSGGQYDVVHVSRHIGAAWCGFNMEEGRSFCVIFVRKREKFFVESYKGNLAGSYEAFEEGKYV